MSIFSKQAQRQQYTGRSCHMPTIHALSPRPILSNSTPVIPSSPPPRRRGTPNNAKEMSSQLVELRSYVAAVQRHPNERSMQHAELHLLESLGLSSSRETAERAESLADHFQSLGQEAAEPIGTAREGRSSGQRDWGLANRLWSMIHPASQFWGASCGRIPWPAELWRAMGDAREAERLGLARRTYFYTDDHVQLSGFIVSPTPEASRRRLPLLVMAIGNAELAEVMIPFAHRHATMLDVNVLIYNTRGVGSSLGGPTHPEQALIDTRAAICHANSLTSEIAVWSCSLGGALMARTLALLAAENNASVQNVGLFMCLNSFTDLATIMGKLSGRPPLSPKIMENISARALSMCGIDPLSTLAGLESGDITRPMVVFNSLEDTMMEGKPNLAKALLERGVKRDKLQVALVQAGNHNDLEEYLDVVEYKNALELWRHRNK